MSTPRAWTRPRLFLALLLAALVAGAVPVRPPSARGEKASGAAWRAASARTVAARPDLDARGAPPLPGVAPEPLSLPRIIRAGGAPAPRARPTPPPFARSPLPRAPPVA